MRETIKRSCAALLFLAGAAVLAAGLPAQYAGTPTAKQFPGEDVLVLSESHAVTLLADGRAVTHVRVVEKLLTYQAMDMAGDPKIPFDKENQDLAILTCRTYSPEGLVVDAKANSFNEMTPYELERAPAYTAWREMVVTKVGLDVNAVNELEYTLTDKRPHRRFLEGVVPLAGAYPAVRREVSITLPQGTALRYAVANGTAEPAVTEGSGTRTYTWTLKDVPAVRLAYTSMAERAFLPTLLYTTCPDWAHQTSALGPLVEKAVSSTSTALDKKTDALIHDASTDMDKVVALNAYVAEGINTVHWPAGDFDFAPRDASAVFDSGYGHALDKGVLLAAMLKRAGLTATVGLAAPEETGDAAKVACLTRMEQCLVRVELGKSHLVMDPTAKLSERSHRDFQGLVILPLRAEFTEPHTATELGYPDTMAADFDVKLAGDLSFEGTGTLTLQGRYSPFYEVMGSETALKGYLASLTSSVLPGAEVTAQSVSRMEPYYAVFTVTFKAPAPAKSTVKAFSIGVPEHSLLKGYRGSHLDSRDLPLVLAGPGSEKVTVRFSFAEGLKASFVPKDAEVKGSAGRFARTWKPGEGTLVATTEVQVPERIVPARDYPAFRDLYGRANVLSGRTLIF